MVIDSRRSRVTGLMQRLDLPHLRQHGKADQLLVWTATLSVSTQSLTTSQFGDAELRNVNAV